MNTEYRNIKIAEEARFENVDFVDYDFTKSDITEVVFENVRFVNCFFDKTVCRHTRFWCCFFENCSFTRVDLSNTYLGAWGGGQDNCKFIKCKLGRIFDGSYITNTLFDNCKIKNCIISSFYLDNVSFIGMIDDLSFKRMDINNDISRHQPSKEVINRINEHIGMDGILNCSKVFINHIDFSLATIKFLDFNNCEINTINPPTDDKHLLVDSGLLEISIRVSGEIERNWQDERTKSWALNCVRQVQEQTPITIVSWYEFKHFENEEFADRLLEIYKNENNKWAITNSTTA